MKPQSESTDMTFYNNPDWYYGWHFLPSDGCLSHTYPKVKVEAGEAYFVESLIVPCANGLHASSRAIDALRYAPGPIVCRVILSGTIVHHKNDKAAGSERTVLGLADATSMLHEFACQCAEDVLHLTGSGRTTAEKAIETNRRWLKGEASDQELAAASAAAGAAARAAASAAARATQNLRLESMLHELLGLE